MTTIRSIMESISPSHLVSDYNTTWSVYLLIKYVLTYHPTILRVKLDSFKKFIVHKIWINEHGNTISINDVLRSPHISDVHNAAIDRAKIRFPILIDYNGTILDGAHRLAKCIKKDKEYIDVQIIDSMILNKCRVGHGYGKESLDVYEKKLTRERLNSIFDKRLGTKDKLNAPSRLSNTSDKAKSRGGAIDADSQGIVFRY